MSTSENKEFIQRYLDAINRKPKPESVLRLFIAEQPLIDHILTAEAVMPLYELEVEEMVAEGDLVSLRGWVTGTHLGPIMGIEPTGKPIHIALFITYKIRDGKIVDHWMLTDNMAMMQQISEVPNPVD